MPVDQLVDMDALRRSGREPTKAALRAALPRGWVLEDDGLHARRDLRLLFREGWILLLGIVTFGAVGAAFVLGAMPRGWAGVLRVALLVLCVLLIGGVVGPLVTRALLGKSGRDRRRS